MTYPNTFQNSNFSVSFSNIPTITNLNDMKYYDGYVTSCLLPNYNIVSAEIAFKGSSRYVPMSRKNDNPSQLSIEFKLSENAINYINLFQFMQQLKYGQNMVTELVRDNIVKRINVDFMDNQKRTLGRIYFTDCFITSLGTLNLRQGVNEEITFDTTFMYTEMKWDQ